jgi:hypothetical protein
MYYCTLFANILLKIFAEVFISVHVLHVVLWEKFCQLLVLRLHSLYEIYLGLFFILHI